MAALESLKRLRTLPPVQQRKAAAILGALVADCATTPLHWIYDQPKVAELAKENNGPEYYPTSQCPYYSIDTGSYSTYGDQVYVALKNVVENKGFDDKKLADAIFKHFGPGTPYENARQQTTKPLKGPWTNHNIKIFLAKRENGEEPDGDTGSKDPDGLCKAVPIIALLSGKPEVFENVVKCINTTQLNPIAIGYAIGCARVLNSTIEKGGEGCALDAAVTQLRDDGRAFKYETDAVVADAIVTGKEAAGLSHQDAVTKFSLSCAFPGSFLGMVQGISAAKDYTSAVRNGILAAGDNCSRNTVIGAVSAARFGLDSIPEEWITKMTKADEVLGYVEQIVKL